MQTNDLRNFLKANYRYSQSDRRMQLKNGTEATVDVASISGRAGGAPYVNPVDRFNKNRIQPSEGQYFFLCGEMEKEDTRFLRDALDNENYQDDDYIISIELCLPVEKMRTLSQFDYSSIIKNQIKANHSIGIYRKDCITSNIENSYYLVLIRVKENGNLTTKYLDAYFASSDSRTYQGFKYTINQALSVDKTYNPKDTTEWPKNLLVFGAPGTGKSYAINKKIEELGWHDTMERVTFYEDYSYEKFVGEYVPKRGKKSTSITGEISSGSVGLKTEGDGIVYEFVPGVFLRMIADAWFSWWIGEGKNYVLVIEEINRANAASVFGDMFQLLDRDDKGESEYTITLPDEMKCFLTNYLNEKKEEKKKEKKLEDDNNYLEKEIKNLCNSFKLPGNLYLWATMNSADQGVFPMDSAFKRRWSFLYKSVNEPKTDNNRYIYTYVKEKPSFVLWDELRKEINSVMGRTENNIEEDRFIGAWYFKPEEMSQIYNYTRAVEQKCPDIDMLPNPLCDKLFHYLRQDVFRNNPRGIFQEEYQTLYKIREGMKDGKSLEEILRIELKPETYKAANEISFVLSADMKENITLEALKKESEGKNWEVSQDFVIDRNKTCQQENIGDSTSEEIEKLIQETISLIKEEIKKGKNEEEAKKAIEAFETWIEELEETQNVKESDQASVNQETADQENVN